MKKFIKLSILLITSFFMTQLSFGKDIVAVTSDGKTVVLHDNGKWEYTSSIPEGAILIKYLGTRPYNNRWCNFKFELTNNTGQDIQRFFIEGKLVSNFGDDEEVFFGAKNISNGKTIRKEGQIRDECERLTKNNIEFTKMQCGLSEMSKKDGQKYCDKNIIISGERVVRKF
jgi:hypothetical protein